MLSTLFLILLLVCFAAVIYPFPPFKTRKGAIGFAIVTFILSVAIFAVEESDPELIAERTEAAHFAVTEAERALEAGDIEKAKSFMDALDYRAAEQEKDKVLLVESKIEAAEVYPTLQATILNDAFQADQKIGALETLWDDIENNQTKVLLADKFEADLLALISPIPASELELNANGYAFLATVDNASEEKNANYQIKANEYREKISVAEKAKILGSVRQATRGLLKEYDKISGITWYRHPDSPKYINSRTTTHLYLGIPDSGGAGLRLKTSYVSDDWLFVDNVEAFIDGNTYLLTRGGFDRDNNTKIWEWKDELPSRDQLSTLMKMAEGREVILRFNGAQYRKDKPFSEADKHALAAMLEAYGEIPQ